MADSGKFGNSDRCLPPGIAVLKASCGGRHINYAFAKGLVLALTFAAYAAFHASRKPPSIVKAVLTGGGADAGWAPFSGPGGKGLLGSVDLAFLLAYTAGMFYCGHLGDRLDLRHFLSFGMVASGVSVSLFGMGYFYQIHSLWYYVAVSVLAGAVQATGWPSVVAVMGNWFGKGKRGLVMGVWNAHTSVGNIVGSLVAARALAWGWGWAFLLPGLLISALGVIVFLFLIVQPSDLSVGRQVESPPAHRAQAVDDLEAKAPLMLKGGRASQGVPFVTAIRIPGVASYALCLFFSKLVAYVFLYWLPYYLRTQQVAGRVLTAREAGDLSALFDIGGIFGGAATGYLSDATGASATVAAAFMLCCVPCMYAFRTYSSASAAANLALMALSGFLVNGPYSLITTAVSADLGTHESLQGNERALATVTAIIDGMGSLGAAVGPVAVGYIADTAGGFDSVFHMLYASALVAALLLSRLVARELARGEPASKM